MRPSRSAVMLTAASKRKLCKELEWPTTRFTSILTKLPSSLWASGLFWVLFSVDAPKGAARPVLQQPCEPAWRLYDQAGVHFDSNGGLRGSCGTAAVRIP